MNRLWRHLKANVIAYVALFVALGGTSYAVIRLPANSVGSRQIRNHSIDRVKLDPRYINGSIRMWASVDANGKVLAGGQGITVTPQGSVPGDYGIGPKKGSKLATPRGCAVIASVDDHSTVPGFADAELGLFPGNRDTPWQVVVATYATQGSQQSLPFDFAVIC